MWHLKYRPQNLSEVLSNEATVKTLKATLSSDDAFHFYLFVGEGGTGKTTLARLIGKELGIEEESVREINAADSNGVDFAREFIREVQYRGFHGRRLYIVDECHRLTPEAQDVLLKDALEDTPSHVYIVFCTTDPQKIKKTVMSRAAVYQTIKPTIPQLVDYLGEIAEKEGYPDFNRRLLGKIAKGTDRVVRDSLILLHQTCLVDDDKREGFLANYSVSSTDSNLSVLANSLLYPGKAWNVVMEALNNMPNHNGVIFALRNYMAKVLANGNPQAMNQAFNFLIASKGYGHDVTYPDIIKILYETFLRNKENK